MERTTPMSMCPMAETCRALMEKPKSGLVMSVPGVVFIILGVAILIEPRLLTWLVAIALMVLGAAMFMVARFMRKAGMRIQSMQQ